MRKLIVPVVAVLSLTLAGCVSESTGQGTVTSLEIDAPEYYSARECAKKFGKARCLVPVMKEPQEYEVNYKDSGSGQTREAEVSQEVFAACAVGDFYDGSVCVG